ncbi:MAG TPA: ABC transporter ATP-binding protein [Alphaproteobacteria bacterium]|nr:ABC transporter ATP-binding protein [Alphaproteobacteria bacterium]
MDKARGNLVLYMMGQVWRYAGAERGRVALDYVLLTIAYSILALQPVALANLIDAAQKGGPGALHKALGWAAAYGSTIVAFWVFNYPARVLERRTAFAVSHNFIGAMYRMVTEMPLRWHQDHHSADVISRVNKANGALYGFAQGQFMLFQLAVRFIGSVAALTWYSWPTACAALGVSVVIAFTIRFFDRRIVPLVVRTNEAGHRLGAGVQDYIGNVVTVLALRLEGDTGDEISRRFMALKPSLWPEISISESKWATVGFLLIGSQAALVGGYIAFALRRGTPLDMGAVVAIFQCLTVVNLMFFQSMVTLDGLMRQNADMRSVENLIADHARRGKKPAAEAARAWRQIRIEGLSFTHREGEDVLHTLRGVDLSIAAGQRIALIGLSGAGKTTLLTLLRGLYEPAAGRLAIDGESYGDLKPLAGFTTLVPQDCEIFENSILYNLTLGTNVPEEAVREAMAVTTFDSVAAALPHALATDIRERGVNLSGGQKQRLALTRGLLAARDSSLLLLDEPTSSVDLATEAAIFDRLFSARRDKAIVASVHRLHLLPRFDHIVLMQDGTIVEQGGFAELLARRGDFYALWQKHLAQGGGQDSEIDHVGEPNAA